MPKTDHFARPWRIHELTPDFRLYDVWLLPTPGGAGDFGRLVDLFAEGDTNDNPSWMARTLFAVRWKLGDLLGWDDAHHGVIERVITLRARLPQDLINRPAGPHFDLLPFKAVYLLDDEWAAEMSNRTVHAVMHLSWIADAEGDYRGQMAVLVRPNGMLGRVYMGLISPFRHVVVYPPMMRDIEQDWKRRSLTETHTSGSRSDSR